MDTVRKYASYSGLGNAPNTVFADTTCKAQNTAELLSHHDHREIKQCCSGCMKFATPNDDCFCNEDAGKCPGVSSSTSLVPVVCQMVMQSMFFAPMYLPAEPTLAGVKAALESLTAECLAETWGLGEAEERLAQLYAAFNGAMCAADTREITRAAITAALFTGATRRNRTAPRGGTAERLNAAKNPACLIY